MRGLFLLSRRAYLTVLSLSYPPPPPPLRFVAACTHAGARVVREGRAVRVAVSAGRLPSYSVQGVLQAAHVWRQVLPRYACAASPLLVVVVVDAAVVVVS